MYKFFSNSDFGLSWIVRSIFWVAIGCVARFYGLFGSDNGGLLLDFVNGSGFSSFY